MPEVVAMVDEVDELRQSADDYFREIGEGAVAYARSRGIKLRHVVVRGHAADEIIRFAEAEARGLDGPGPAGTLADRAILPGQHDRPRERTLPLHRNDREIDGGPTIEGLVLAPGNMALGPHDEQRRAGLRGRGRRHLRAILAGCRARAYRREDAASPLWCEGLHTPDRRRGDLWRGSVVPVPARRGDAMSAPFLNRTRPTWPYSTPSG